MPTFFTLEAVKLYGLPTEVDGISLSQIQACRVIPEIVGKLMDEAGHDLKMAKQLAVETFRRLYSLQEGKWIPRKYASVGSGHARLPVENKFAKLEEDMGRTRERSPARRLIEEINDELSESGARNNRKDLTAIREVIKYALSQLSSTDAEQTLKNLGFRVRGNKI